MAARPESFPAVKKLDPLRVPPNSIEAEQAVLGGLMLSAEAWDKVADRINEHDFYRRDHALIFRAIGELSNKGMPADAVTLGEWFDAQGIAELVGGSRYILELANTTPSAANIVSYADIVREKSVLRQLIDAGTEIAGDAFVPEGRSSHELLETAEQKVFRIAEAGARGRKGFVSMGAAVKEAFAQLQHRYENRGAVTGLATGLRDFDEMTAGLQPSDLIILAARPSMGKCLSHDAELVADDGSIVTMAEVVARRDTGIATLGDDLRLHRTLPSDYIDDGLKPVFEVSTRLGRRVETTLPHPFLTPEGWKPLAELQPGDWIAVPRVLDTFGDASWRECEVKLLAYLLGDGGLTGSTPRFTNGNPEIGAEFVASVAEFGGVRASLEHAGERVRTPTWRIGADSGDVSENRRRFATGLQQALVARALPQRQLAQAVGVSAASVTHWMQARTVPDAATAERLGAWLDWDVSAAQAARHNAPNALTLWLRQLGLDRPSAHGKFVPAQVFRLRREQVALFLNRLFATDGWASVLSSGQAQVGYASVSEKLARQIQHLLLRFGIIAKLRQRWVRYRDTRRASWQLEITDAGSLARFVGSIGIHGKHAAVERVRTALLGRGSRSNVDLIPATVWQQIAAAKGSMSWAELARRAGYNDSNSYAGRRALTRPHLAAIAMVLDAPELMALAHSDVLWDRIERITPLGDKQVYDLTIPVTHNFVANDICVHNTALALNMAEYAAIKGKKAVAVFSMEMSASQLAFRLISSLGRINQQHLRTGELEDADWPRVSSAITLLKDAKIFIDDTPALSPGELRARARRLKREHDLGLIVIDYLQLMAVPGTRENRATEISEISRSLKALAKELNVPVIALSQLNRSLEQRTDKRPVMADLRESGAIEQDADVIVFIYRDEYYNKESPDKGLAEIIIGKQRNGPTGSVKLTFLGHYTKFENHASAGFAGSFE